MRYMEEAARRVAVREEVDVLVVGGGVAGCVAAISAARAGARTAVIEAFGTLGGAATQGLVTPFMHTGIAGNPMCSAISDELNRRAITLGFGRADAQGNEGHVDPIALAYVLEEAVLEKKGEAPVEEKSCSSEFCSTRPRVQRRVRHSSALSTLFP